MAVFSNPAWETQKKTHGTEFVLWSEVRNERGFSMAIALPRRFIMALPTRVSRMDQYDPSDLVQTQFDNMLGRIFGARDAGAMSGWAPYGVDVREDADHVYVEAELP